MFYILERELYRNNITREKLAHFLGIGMTAISSKMNGKTQFTLEEILKIKEMLNFDGSIDDLFKTD